MPNLRAIAIREVDDTWRKLRAVHHACKAAGIEPPIEVTRFFAYMDPNDIDNEGGAEFSLLATRACKEFHDFKTGERGLIVELAELSQAVVAVRFSVVEPAEDKP